MKKSLFKRIIASVLTMAMMVSMSGMSGVVFADEGNGVGDENGVYCISKAAFDEITEVEDLLRLAIKQESLVRSNLQINSDENQFFVDQVLEKREYSDGTVEYDSVKTGILILTEDGIIITPREVILNGKLDDIPGYKNNVTVFLSMYIGSKFSNDDIASPWVHRLDKTVSLVQFGGTPGTGGTPISCEMIHCAGDYQEYKTFSCNAAATQTYTLNSTDRSFYGAKGNYVTLYAQSVVTQQDGEEVIARNFVRPEWAPVDPFTISSIY